MNPEVERLLDLTVQLPVDRRHEFLARECPDPQVRAEVESLLPYAEGAESYFDAAVSGVASSLRVLAEPVSGDRIGAYRIVSPIGRGGMGSVYLAERADGAFDQRTAVKVVQPANVSFLLDHFQRERSILARLNHPYIARILDGGQTTAGLPYLVMEYVCGQPIDQFCDSRAFSLHSRMELFVKVCDAIQYAHQNLIVHRDLKPANILVTAESEPKLLDFGIAKILEPGETGSAGISTRVLTPEYASPEQIRGDPITTATDIYSLGAVLYRLLSGKPPHAIAKLSPLEAAQAIAGAEVAAIEQLPRDLNAILQKALHRDPARRYRTAEEFARDIVRFMHQLPVLAAPDSLGYRARKFLHRNWLLVTAVAAMMTALTTGAGVALWQARRAERRFADVRRLANTFLFDFEDAIHNLPGATNPRLLVVNTAGEYLNRLAAEAGEDRQLWHELADSYKKLGDIQGNVNGGNIGRFPEAAASYRKGLAIRDSLGDERSSDPRVQAGYLFNLTALASLERFAGDPGNAGRLRAKSVELSDRWVSSDTHDADLLTAAAFAYGDLTATERLREDFAGAAAHARKHLALLVRASELDPANVARRRAVASGHLTAGYVELDAGKFAAAIDHFNQGNQLLEQLMVAGPGNVSVRRLRLVLLQKLGEATQRLRTKEKGHPSDAFPFFQEAYRIGDNLAAEDPADEGVQTDLAGLCQLYGSNLQMEKQAAKGLPLLVRAIDIYARQVRNVPGDTNAGFNLAVTRIWASDCRRDLNDLSGALNEARMAADEWDRLLKLRPGTFRYLHQKADTLNTLGNLLALRGDVDGARECFRTGLGIIKKLPTQDASFSTSVVIHEL